MNFMTDKIGSIYFEPNDLHKNKVDLIASAEKEASGYSVSGVQESMAKIYQQSHHRPLKVSSSNQSKKNLRVTVGSPARWVF